jgi:hypothetical protein
LPRPMNAMCAISDFLRSQRVLSFARFYFG